MSEFKNRKIGILDYGVGNLFSIRKALKKFTDEVEIIEDAEGLKNIDGLVLPGVGSFEAGTEGLKRRMLVEKVRECAFSGKPVLGICLGAQLLLTKGYEFGEFDGLNIIPGKAIYFPKLKARTKIPHIGWNKIIFPGKNSGRSSIFQGLDSGAYMYFVHSYILKPADKNNILATTTYGGYNFCSVIRKDNIFGCQFHPEKSGNVGLKIIENFVNLVGNYE